MPIMPAPVEKPTSASVLDNDVYAATITLAKPVMENGTFAITENGKAQVDLRFQLDDETDDEGNPIVLYRSKMAVSYGQYAGKWADWATLIAAALGIPEGDKAQRNVDTDDLQGKKVRVQTAKVASTKGDGKVYVNCVGYLAPKKAKPAPVAALVDYPATVAAPAHRPAADVGLEDDDLSSLPF
jgi:hypothetical protein